MIDIGLGSIAAAGAGRSTGLPQIDLRDIATAGLWVRSYVDRIEDYYERGPGSRTPPSGDPFHNMGVYHWDVLDAALSTATLVEQRIHTPPRDDWTTVVANSADRVAWGVLARARKGRRAGTVCDAVARLARDGGVETLLVSLGLNNALGAMTSLAPAWTPSGYPGMSPNERLAAKSSSNVWRPSAFAADWSILEAELRKTSAQRIVIATIPSVTIAPIARGFGAKVRPESRYFPYYTWPWISDDFFDPSRDAHVTEDEARAIDSAVDAYNETIIDSVARARADGLDWQVFELGGLVERLAFRRYVESPWARPGWWEPFEMPTELAAAHPVPNTRFFRAGPEGRIDGGLYSLDGAHPTTTGYALIADECMRLLQQAGVEFRSRNGQVRPAPASVDFARILGSDTLNSDPPIVPTIGFLGWIEPLVNWVERNGLWSGFKRG